MPTMINRGKELIRISPYYAMNELQCKIGTTSSGEPFSFDLAKLPHLLIGGACGQGKTQCIHSIICSLLEQKSPSELRFVLIDPKCIELSVYKPLAGSYLLSFVENESEDAIVHDFSHAVNTLNALCAEMRHRYELLAAARVRNISQYNAKSSQPLTYIVVVIDEYGDLAMMQSKKEIESPVIELAQKARAVGIHLVISTQRTSNDVLTNELKTNCPARIAFRVCSEKESRIILDKKGAECLTAKGEMLFSNWDNFVHVKGAMVADDEIERIVKHIAVQNPETGPYVLPKPAEEGSLFIKDEDPLLREAANFVVREQCASFTLLQQELHIGYMRAGKIIDRLNEMGVVGPGHPREVLVKDESSLEEIFEQL